MITYIAPGLNCLALLNPANPPYETTGGPLWALAPVLRPVLPIVVTSMRVSFICLLIWFLGVLVHLVEVIVNVAALFAEQGVVCLSLDHATISACSPKYHASARYSTPWSAMHGSAGDVPSSNGSRPATAAPGR